MPNPALIAAATATAASSVLGFTGGKGAAKSAAAIGEYNAKLAEQERDLVRKQAAQTDVNVRRQGERIASTQRLATAASGIQMAGSPMEALADTYFGMEQDSLQIAFSGDLAANRKIAEAALARAGGQARKSALMTQAYSTLIDGAGKSANLLS